MGLVLFGTGKAGAQGIERESLAGENSASALHSSNLENQPYNFQLGPVNLRLEAGGTVMFNDNVNLANTGKISDFIFEPSVGVRALWQATEENALTFDLGIGYKHYLQHSTYDSLEVTPNSNTQFSIFIGDFKVTLKDSFSYEDDPTQVGQLSNTPQFSRFTNDAGVNVDWDLNDMIVSLGYDHTNFWVFQSAYKYLDYQTDMVTPQINFILSPTLNAGLNASFSDVRYDQDVQNNYTQVRGGPFVTAEITENLSVNAQAGWVSATYDRGGRNNDTEDIEAYYASAGLTHRINDVVTESLTAGRDFLPGITTNFTQRTYVRYSPTWQATSALSVSSEFWWENLDDSNGPIRQTSNRYAASLNLAFIATDHLTLNLGYQYILKSADVSSLNYQQNTIILGARYEF